MSNFFDSEIIQEELKEINTLQEEIYGSLLAFSSMDRDARIDKVDKLAKLLEKQRVMYTRLSLSDDPKALGEKMAEAVASLNAFSEKLRSQSK